MEDSKMKRRLLVWTIAFGILLPGSLYLAYGGNGITSSSSPLTFNIFNPIVDEQNTTAFYNNGGTFCIGTNNPVDGIAFFGDGIAPAPITTYDMGSPWSPAPELTTSTSYTNGTYCGTSCLKVVFGS